MIDILFNQDGVEQTMPSSDVCFVVNLASNYEYCSLTCQLGNMADEKKIQYSQARIGGSHLVDYVLFVGVYIPISVVIYLEFIDGFPVAFIQPSGNAYLHTAVEEWIDCNFNCKWDNSRKAVCDAHNFHHCLLAIDQFKAEREKAEAEITKGILRVGMMNDYSNHVPVPKPPLGYIQDLAE